MHKISYKLKIFLSFILVGGEGQNEIIYSTLGLRKVLFSNIINSMDSSLQFTKLMVIGYSF